MSEWKRVVSASDCDECVECGELLCPECAGHYGDCPCPGPHQDDEYKYQVNGLGVLMARRWGAYGDRTAPEPVVRPTLAEQIMREP